RVRVPAAVRSDRRGDDGPRPAGRAAGRAAGLTPSRTPRGGPRMAGPNDMTTYPEDELRRFYARHRALHEAGDWQGLGDLFTDDASYLDSVYGWSHGLPAIRSFLERSMTGLEDWS